VSAATQCMLGVIESASSSHSASRISSFVVEILLSPCILLARPAAEPRFPILLQKYSRDGQSRVQARLEDDCASCKKCRI